MKLMVAELQRQLDEVNSEPTAEQASGAGGTSQNLVDLSGESDSASGNVNQSNANQRRNPFGDTSSAVLVSSAEGFGTTSFQQSSSHNNTQARTFKQMHEDFGAYIKEKMASYSNVSAPLVDLGGS